MFSPRCQYRVSYGAVYAPSVAYPALSVASRAPPKSRPAGPGWIYEIKHDSFRTMAQMLSCRIIATLAFGHCSYEQWRQNSQPARLLFAIRPDTHFVWDPSVIT